VSLLYPRTLQDYIVLYFGSAVFKISRLLAVAILCVHCFACAFYLVKRESAESLDDVDSFYESRGVSSTVRPGGTAFLCLISWPVEQKSNSGC
jgi:hypothetical protein